MFTYITLYRYTSQGIRSVKDSPNRVEQARQTLEKAGAKLKMIYLTTGRYDLVAVSEWPTEEAAMAFLLAQGAAGNVTPPRRCVRLTKQPSRRSSPPFREVLRRAEPSRHTRYQRHFLCRRTWTLIGQTLGLEHSPLLRASPFGVGSARGSKPSSDRPTLFRRLESA